MTETTQDLDLAVGRKALQRIAEDVGMMVDAEIQVEEVEAERIAQRAAGDKTIHISFKLAITMEGRMRFGCLLLPLAEAIAVSAMLMVTPEPEVDELRGKVDLDDQVKDAMLEVGQFIAAAVIGVVRETAPEVNVQFAGCQGVRPAVRPAFPFEPGDELVLVRARMRVGKYPAFLGQMMLPVF